MLTRFFLFSFINPWDWPGFSGMLILHEMFLKMILQLDLKQSYNWKWIPAPPITTDLKTPALSALTCAVLHHTRVSWVNMWWLQFMCGQRRLCSQNMLISSGTPRGGGGGGAGVLLSNKVLMCHMQSERARTESAAAVLSIGELENAMNGSVCILAKVRIMSRRGNVIGLSTVLYNAAMD